MAEPIFCRIPSAGFTHEGRWGFNSDCGYGFPDQGAACAWDFPGLAPGTYSVRVGWNGAADHSAAAVFSVTVDGLARDFVVDQRADSAGTDTVVAAEQGTVALAELERVHLRGNEVRVRLTAPSGTLICYPAALVYLGPNPDAPGPRGPARMVPRRSSAAGLPRGWR